MSHDYDLFVIGAGSGGVRAARTSAGFGARVAIAEERHLGGTCVNVGCIPKKLLVYGAEFADSFEDARAYGWDTGSPRFDWKTLIEHKNREIARLNGVYDRLLDRAGVTRFRARATVVGPHTVEMGGERKTAKHILVATGSTPVRPTIQGAEDIISSDEAFFLDQLPPRVAVAGGGYIGVEFASIFHRLGSRVLLVHRGNQLLRGFDEDLRTFLGEQLHKQGLDLRLSRTIERVDRQPGGALQLELSDGQREEVDLVLAAVGRVPNTRNMGLEEVGVELGERGELVVDQDLRTRVPSIYGLGDVIDRFQLTPVALHEGMAFAKAVFGGERARVDYDHVPTAVFSEPQVGTVGRSEQQAHHACRRVEVYRSTFTPLKHTLTGRPERALVKLVVDGETDRVLGVHMVGPEAGEIIQGFAVALRCGATKADLDGTIGIHPTLAEELVTLRTPG